MINYLMTIFILCSCCSVNTYNTEINEVKYDFSSEITNDTSSDEINFDENLEFNAENFLPITMFDYFNNLKNFIPKNDYDYNCCVFVSLIEVLAYYDSTFNDDIIPQQYDYHYNNYTTFDDYRYNSPGVFMHNYSSVSQEMSTYGLDANKNNCIDYTYNKCFFSYLVKNFNNNILNNYYDENNSTSQYHKTMHPAQFQDLLDYIYGDNSIIVNEKYYDYDKAGKNSTRTQTINEIKNLIDQGKPVILGLMGTERDENGNLVGHSVVAYDYDENNIYANFGYQHYYTTHKALFNYDNNGNIVGDYDRIQHYVTFDFPSFSHKHSDNFVINGVNYCGCGFHEHKLQYSSLNCFEHIAQCCCGYSEIGTHNHTNEHNLSCDTCDVIYSSYNPTSSSLSSSIDNFSLDMLVGSYGLKEHIYLKIDYEWEIIPQQKFLDYIVVSWSYKYELSDYFLASNYYGNTLNEVFNNCVDSHNYGSMFKEIYWTFDLTNNLNDNPKGTALIKLDYKSGYDISFNVRYYHVTFTAAAIKGIYLDSSNMYTTDAIQVHNISYNYSL